MCLTPPAHVPACTQSGVAKAAVSLLEACATRLRPEHVLSQRLALLVEGLGVHGLLQDLATHWDIDVRDRGSTHTRMGAMNCNEMLRRRVLYMNHGACLCGSVVPTSACTPALLPPSRFFWLYRT